VVDPDGAAPGAADDDLVLARAVAGGGDDLVTGDRGLSARGEVRGIAIVAPRDLVGVLAAALLGGLPGPTPDETE